MMLVPGPVITLTIKQRHDIYKLALVYYHKGLSEYLCSCLYRAFTEPLRYCHYEIKESLPLFPEFLIFRPESKTIYTKWWPEEDRKTRIEVLEACIRATEI